MTGSLLGSSILTRIKVALVLLVVLAVAVVAVLASRGDTMGQPGDAEFFAAFRQDGPAASESRFYGSITEMTHASSVVVRARVIDVVRTRTIRSEDESGLAMIGIVLSVHEVVVGTMAVEQITVEFLGGSGDPDDDIRALRAAMPDGDSLWFLRSGTESVSAYRAAMASKKRAIPADEEEVLNQDLSYYWLISSQGLYLDGLGHVVNPLANDEHRLTDLFKEAERHENLTSLASTVRGR